MYLELQIHVYKGGKTLKKKSLKFNFLCVGICVFM